MANTQQATPGAVPDRTKLPQPKRTIEPPLAPGTKNTNDEPDTSGSSGRSRSIEATDDKGNLVKGSIPPAAFNHSVLDQLAEGAAANDTPLPGEAPPPRSQMTTTASLGRDPNGIQPMFTDPASQAPPPTGPAKHEDLRTVISIGPIDPAIVSQEKMVRVRPKSTFSRFIGPNRWYFTKGVICEVPVSVREALLREDLAVPYWTD